VRYLQPHGCIEQVGIGLKAEYAWDWCGPLRVDSLPLQDIEAFVWRLDNVDDFPHLYSTLDAALDALWRLGPGLIGSDE
jgi:hypothetical protein